jgi:hypothetical protein
VLQGPGAAQLPASQGAAGIHSPGTQGGGAAQLGVRCSLQASKTIRVVAHGRMMRSAPFALALNDSELAPPTS